MFYFSNNTILPIALFFFQISPSLIRIVTIVLFYVVYIQSIGSGKGVFSGLSDDFLLDVCPSQILASSLLSIVPAGNIKPKRLTNLARSQFNLSGDLKEILIGLSLGDLYINKRISCLNPSLMFRQGIVHEEYLRQLYTLFQNYCPQGPKIQNPKPDKRTGKVYSAIYFQTYALPCFTELYNLFYLDGKKLVPLNMGDLLTPLGLCYWIGDDGGFCKTTQRITLATHSFTLAEVELLISVLVNKFGLKCTLDKQNAGFRIRISAKSLADLQKLLAPHMPPMMLYKIGL